jgi:outer membrane lipoprotein SlyB
VTPVGSRRGSLHVCLLSLVVLAVPARDSAAQSTPLAPGKPAMVVAIDGSAIEGTLVTWSADAIAVRTDAGVRTMSLADVRQVSTTRTHAWDWAKKGALWGGALGLLAGVASGESDKLASLVLVAAPAALWGGIFGAAHRTQEVVFVNKSATRSVAMAPVLTSSRLGVRGVVRW